METNQISSDITLSYPPLKYQYIIVNFVKYNEIVFPIIEEDDIDKEINIHKSYFIFEKMNWYHRNEIRRHSDYYSKSVLRNEFSVYLFKKEIVDRMLIALIDENNELIEFLQDKQKEQINFNVLDQAVNKYIENFMRKKLFSENLDKLSRDIHNYLRYNILKESGKSTAGLARPHVPSALILKNLIDTFPSMDIDDLMNMDENIFQMIQIVQSQQEQAAFEGKHIFEDPQETHRQEELKRKDMIQKSERLN